MNKIVRFFVCMGVFALAIPGMAQTPTPEQVHEANLKAYIGMLRQDLKKDKVSIVTELMALSPDQAARFRPVYNEYDKSLTALADERLAFIRLYTDNDSSLSEETATKIATGMLDVQARQLKLQTQYFQRLSKTLAAKDAARCLQIETQIEKLVDLQILSTLPIVD